MAAARSAACAGPAVAGAGACPHQPAQAIFHRRFRGDPRSISRNGFNFHAPDRTTEEFLYELQATNLLTAEQKQSLADFLASCDLIKFAKYEPTETELRGLHASALRLVNETEPRMVLDSLQSTVAAPPPVPATK